MFRCCVLVAVILMTLSCSTHSLIVPQELPSILSLVYSNIPPIRKGTDSRLGFGFRLGEHADFQFLVELGPQKDTRPVGMNQDDDSSSSRKRQANKYDYKKIRTTTTTTTTTEDPSKTSSLLRQQNEYKKSPTLATPPPVQQSNQSWFENLFNNNANSSRKRKANQNEYGRTRTTTTTEQPISLFNWFRNQNDKSKVQTTNTAEEPSNLERWLGNWLNEMTKTSTKANRASPKNAIREPPKKNYVKTSPTISESSLRKLQQLYKMATTTEVNVPIVNQVPAIDSVSTIIAPQAFQPVEVRKTKGEITEELMDVGLD